MTDQYFGETIADPNFRVPGFAPLPTVQELTAQIEREDAERKMHPVSFAAPTNLKAVATDNPEVGGVGNPPSRYQGKDGLQVFDVIDAYEFTYYTGHAFKYLARMGKKASDADNLGKCAHFLEEALRRAPKATIPKIEIISLDKNLRPAAILEAFGFEPETLLYDAAMELLLSSTTGNPRTYLRSALAQVQEFTATL